MASQFLLDPTNLLTLPTTILGAFRHANWKGSYHEAGVPGVAMQFLQSSMAVNSQPFFIRTDLHWQLHDVQALLLRYGIQLWGVGYFNGELYFRVKKRQAHWAQYVMLRAGVPLLHGLLPGSRAIPGGASDAGGSAVKTAHHVDVGLLDLISRLFK